MTGTKDKTRKMPMFSKTEKYILIFLCAIIVIMVGSIFALLSQRSIQTQVPTTIQIPTPTSMPTINAFIDISINIDDPKHPKVIGKTNLPSQTIIMVSIQDSSGHLLGQDKVFVTDGSFIGGPFGDTSGFSYGTYLVQALMPLAKVQSSSVRMIIGKDGELLSGSQVVHDSDGILVVARKEFTTIEPTPKPLATPIKYYLRGKDIGIRKSMITSEITLHSAWKTDELFGKKAFDPQNNTLLILDITFKNINDSVQILKPSSRLFIINILDPNVDLNVYHPEYTYSGESEIEFNKSLEGFSFPKTQKGSSIRISLVYEVPRNTSSYVLTYQTSCATDVKSGSIDCYMDYAFAFSG